MRLFLRKSRPEGGCFVSTRSKNAVAFAALAIVWGTTWVAADTLAEWVPPLHGAAARFLLAALLWIPVILWKRLKLPRGRALGFVLLVSVHMIVVPLLLLLWGQARLPSATVAVSFSAMPLMVVLLTPVLAGRDVPRIALQASIVGLGAMVVALNATFSLGQASGAAVVLLAVASIAASSIVARREFSSLHPIVVTASVLGVAALLLFLASLLLERGQPVQWNRSALGCTGLSGRRGRRSGLCHVLLAAAAAGGVPGWNGAMDPAPGRDRRECPISAPRLVVQHDCGIADYLGLPVVGDARASRG